MVNNGVPNKTPPLNTGKGQKRPPGLKREVIPGVKSG